MKKKISVKSFIPLIILLLLMACIYILISFDILSIETLKMQHSKIKEYVDRHAFLSVLIFILFYILITATSIPIASFITLFAGYIFTPLPATLYVVFAATTGACCIFLAARGALSNFLEKKAGNFIQKIRKGFEENSISYLLFMRIIPLFPFWSLNIAFAFFPVSLWNFAWTSFVGIIPGTFIYAYAGSGLAQVIESNQPLNIQNVFNWKIRIALIGIAVITLLPILYKKWKKRKND